jgi:hypothetical protein
MEEVIDLLEHPHRLQAEVNLDGLPAAAAELGAILTQSPP